MQGLSVTELSLPAVILDVPVWRGGYHEVYRIIIYRGQAPAVPQMDLAPRDQVHLLEVLR